MVGRRALVTDDPGKSLWWAVPPAGLAFTGAMIPWVAGADSPWPTICGAAGLVAGTAVNLTPPVRTWVERRSAARRLTDRAGAVGTIRDRDPTSLRVHRSDRDVITFAPRDLEAAVREGLQQRKPMLVVGPSMAGKTRLVVEVLRRDWGRTPLFFPGNADRLKEVLASPVKLLPGSVVFLDDLDRFLA